MQILSHRLISVLRTVDLAQEFETQVVVHYTENHLDLAVHSQVLVGILVLQQDILALLEVDNLALLELDNLAQLVDHLYDMIHNNQ